MGICTFLGLIGHYWQFIKGFAWITQPLNKHLASEGASRKSEWVLLSKGALETFQALKQACMSTPVLAFADYTKDFLLKTDASKRDWEQYFPKNKHMGNIAQSPMAARPSWPMKRTIIPLNLSSWHWNGPSWNISKNICCTNPFLLRTDNNPLTYIMTTPNLDATGHQWVGALARFNFQLEYQKGQDNMVADALSHITSHLSPEAMQSVLDGVTLGTAHRAEGYGPSVVEGDHNVEKEVCVTAGWVQVQMHMTNWAAAQKEDPVLNAMLNWLGAQKKTDLRTLLGEYASRWRGLGGCGGITSISQLSRTPSIYTLHPQGRVRIYYSLWPKRNIELLLWMGVTGM